MGQSIESIFVKQIGTCVQALSIIYGCAYTAVESVLASESAFTRMARSNGARHRDIRARGADRHCVDPVSSGTAVNLSSFSFSFVSLCHSSDTINAIAPNAIEGTTIDDRTSKKESVCAHMAIDTGHGAVPVNRVH